MKRLLLILTLSISSLAQVNVRGGAYLSGPVYMQNVTPIPSFFFGLQVNNSAVTMPTPGPNCVVGVQFCFGLIRYWDFTNAMELPFIFPTNSTPNWTVFDPWIAYAKTNGLKVVLVMGRTPDWASRQGSRCVAPGNPDATCAGPADFSCAYSGTFPTPPAGECWSNVDLTDIGGGTDATYKGLVNQVAVHLAGLNPATYLNVAIWEPWNEANITGMWGSGLTAPLIKMTNDVGFSIHGFNSHNQVTSPNSTEWNFPLVYGVAQYQGRYFSDPQLPAFVDLISIHSYMAMNGSTGQFPCIPGPVPACQQGVAPPEELVNLVAAVHRSVPIWPNYALIDTEFSWGLPNSSFCDPDMRKAFVSRNFLIGWAQGLYSMDWYHYDDSHVCSIALATPTIGGDTSCLGLGYPLVPGIAGWTECPAGIAFQQTYRWMVNNVMDIPCDGPAPPDVSILVNWGEWDCHFRNSDGTQSMAIWNTNPLYTCASGTCPTVNFTVTAQPYTKYYTIDSATPVVIGGGCSVSCIVPIGAKPILLSN